MELKTARLTVLVDPAKKKAFEALCAFGAMRRDGARDGPATMRPSVADPAATA